LARVVEVREVAWVAVALVAAATVGVVAMVAVLRVGGTWPIHLHTTLDSCAPARQYAVGPGTSRRSPADSHTLAIARM
jgi:hypothetical protein